MSIALRKCRLVVIGSINLDFATVVPHMPLQGETIRCLQAKISPGGKGANQALAAAKIGADVTLLARVGDDVFGDVVLSNLRLNGVRTQNILPAEKTGTGKAFIMISDGDNRIILDTGANDALTATDIEKNSDELSLADGILLQLEIPLATVEKAIHIYKGKTPIFLNPAPAIPLDKTLLDGIEYFLPNQVEASTYYGSMPSGDVQIAGALDYFLSLGIRHPMITMGDQGVAYFDGNKHVFSPAFAIEPLDSTAAGDTFAGVFAALICGGVEVGEAVDTAQAAAALACTRYGAQEAIPSKIEVEEFLNAHSHQRRTDGRYSL